LNDTGRSGEDSYGTVRLPGSIEAERQLVEANRKLIEIFDKKIQKKLAEIWGERTGA
jgi:hypothetical protein